MTSLNDSYRTKASIKKISVDALNEERPRPRLAVVTGNLDFVNRKVDIQYPDEPGVSFAVACPSMMPGAVGCEVRVAGKRGNRYVEAVVSGPVAASDDIVLADSGGKRLRTASGDNYVTVESLGGHMALKCWGIVYFDASTHNFRSSDGSVTRLSIDSGYVSSPLKFVSSYPSTGLDGYGEAQFRAVAPTNPRIAFWQTGGSVAPQLAAKAGFGEEIQVLNSLGTSHAPIRASAFNPSSSLRFKTNVESIDDEEILGLIDKVPAPIRFDDLEPELTVNEEGEARPHDCDIDTCGGTKDEPCRAITSHHKRFGFAAEELHESGLGIATCDDQGVVTGYSLDGSAAMALSGLAALKRIVDQQAKVIAELTARLDKDKGKPSKA